MDRHLPFRRLVAILGRYGVGIDRTRGKGSHVLFYRDFENGRVTYPVPTHGKDVLMIYVRGCRRRFRLTTADGVSDEQFYA